MSFLNLDSNEYILDLRVNKNYKKELIKKNINESRLYEKQKFLFSIINLIIIKK